MLHRHPVREGPGDGTRGIARRPPFSFPALLLAAALSGLISVSNSAVASEPVYPNDPDFPRQWALRNTGQLVNWTKGTPGSDINVTRAWEKNTGSKSVVIGLIEANLDYIREDLEPNAWVNPSGVNGCPAGTHGYDVPSGACEPSMHTFPHGTQMAYTMGAVGNNGQGLAGVNWAVAIMGLTLGDSDSWNAPSVLAAIDWAVRAKQAGVDIRVLNASWGGWFGNDRTVAEQIARAGEHGILFVAGAGNYGSGKDNDGSPFYPCNFRVWNEVCVAASDQNDGLWGQSHYGDETVDLAAPGVNMCSGPNDETCDASGTSISTALVSGAAALLVSADPLLTVSQLKARILDNVRPVPELSGKVRTGGVLDVYCAMTNCRAKTTSSSPPVNPPPPSSGGSSSSTGGSSSSPKSGQTAGSSSSTLTNNAVGGLLPAVPSTPGIKGSSPNSNNHQPSETGESEPSGQNVLASRAEGSSENHGSKALWVALGIIALALLLGLTRERKTNPSQELLDS